MSILIVGSDGNQGKRYGAILKSLGKEYVKCDLGRSKFTDEQIEKRVTGIIIASPTDTHIEMIEKYSKFQVPILCEKPITKNPKDFDRLRGNNNLTMVMQYQYLINRHEGPTIGPSSYDYFKHGNDGLVWDCLQIIALADNDVTLAEDSPVWRCRINGQHLEIQEMDWAYVSTINEWLAGKKKQELSYLRAVHEKVAHYAANKAN